VPERQDVPDDDLIINTDVPGWAYAEQQTYSG